MDVFRSHRVRPALCGSRRCLRLSIAALWWALAVAWFAAPTETRAQRSDDLFIWIPPLNAEFSGADAPSRADIDLFFDDLPAFFRDRYGEELPRQIQAIDVRAKAAQDPAFAREVLGQRIIFSQLAAFARKTAFTGTIRVRFFDWDELLSVLDNLRGTSAELPHVMVAPSSWIAHFAERGLLAPLPEDARPPSAYLAPLADTGRARQLFPGWSFGNKVARRTARVFGQQWGPSRPFAVPWLADVRLFFYRKELFGNARLGDRQDLIGALKLVRERQDPATQPIAPLAIPTVADWELVHMFSLLLWGGGDEWLNAWEFLPGKATPETIGAMRELHAAGAAFRQVSRSELENEFLQGKIGSIVTGPWMLSKLQKTLGDAWYQQIAVDLPPFNERGQAKVTWLGGTHLGLTARGALRPEAFELLKHLTQEASAARPAALTGLPATRAGFADLLDSFPEASNLRIVLPRAIEHSRQAPGIPEWADVESRSSRIELFQAFKQMGAGFSELARNEVLAMKRQLDVDVYITPRAVAVVTASLLIALLFIAAMYRVYTVRAAIVLRRAPRLNPAHLQCGLLPIESLSVAWANARHRQEVFTLDLTVGKLRSIWSDSFRLSSNELLLTDFKELSDLDPLRFARIRRCSRSRIKLKARALNFIGARTLQRSAPIRLHGLNFWCPWAEADTDQPQTFYQTLACFVLPQDEHVRRLLTAATARLHRVHPRESLDWTAAPTDRARALYLLEAVYEELRCKRVCYGAEQDFSWVDEAQYIRFPAEILAAQKATCLDLALLLAACIEAMKGEPIVILAMKQAENGPYAHAIVGCWLDRPPDTPVVITDVSRLPSARDDAWILIDSTSLAVRQEGCLPFAKCLRDGDRWFDEMCPARTSWNAWSAAAAPGEVAFWHAVDIAAARAATIDPFDL